MSITKSSRFSVHVLACFLALAATVCAGPSLTVSPDGDDQASGAAQAPLRTLAGALARTRELRKQGEVGEIRIELRSGEYQLAEPLVLRPTDSELVFAAAPAANPVVSGGRLVSGWEAVNKGLWQAPLPEGVATDGRPIRHLFYGGEAQPRSRHPNPANGDWRYSGWLAVGSPASERDRRSFSAALQAVPTIAHPECAEADIFPANGWSNALVPIASLDVETGRISLAADVPYYLSPGNRFRLENAPEWIDQPGEWAIDPAARMVYFRAEQKLFGGSKPTKPVVVPALSALFELQGLEGQPVRNVGFVGIEFTCSLPGTAVLLDTARNCRFDSCTFRDLGGTAIEFRNANRGNVVANCTFSHLGGGGIEMIPGATGHCTDNVISYNHFHHLGTIQRHVAAIMASKSNGNLIAHNLIHHMPRYAISFKRGFGRNIVEWNEIRWTNLETNDSGAIESWQWEPSQGPEYDLGNAIRHNLIADVVGCKTLPDGRLVTPTGTWGIYMDNFSSRGEIVGNLLVRTVLGGICLHGGWENLCQYNICADGAEAAVYYDNMEGRMHGNRVLNNIFYNPSEAPRIQLGGYAPQQIETHDFNVFWPQPAVAGLPGANEGEEWQAWQAAGRDADSQIADPLFANPQADDYRLRSDSPALHLGFRQTDFVEVGLRGTPMWTKTVETEAMRSVPLPPLLPPVPPPASVPIPPPVQPPVPPPVQPPKPRPLHATTPSVVSFVNTGEMNIDGLLAPGEWPTLHSPDCLVIAEKPGYGGTAASHAFASVMRDESDLLVAIDIPLAQPLVAPPDGTLQWGRDDGVELSVQAVTRSDRSGPVFVLRGYPSGDLVCSPEGGAPAEAVEAMATAAHFAATATALGWSAEYSVPWSELGIPAATIDHLRFNLSIRKAATNERLVWVGTSGEDWQLQEAGVVRLSPVLGKNAQQTLANGAFEEPGPFGPRNWSVFGNATALTIAPAGVADGSCLQFAAEEPDKEGAGIIQSATLPAPGNYLLALQARAESLKTHGDGGLVVSVRHMPIEGRGRMRAAGQEETFTRFSTLWERLELPVEIPPDTAVMTITIQFRNATGTLWIDQASMRLASTQ